MFCTSFSAKKWFIILFLRFISVQLKYIQKIKYELKMYVFTFLRYKLSDNAIMLIKICVYYHGQFIIITRIFINIIVTIINFKMQSLRKIWFFRSPTSAGLAFIGFSAVGYYIFSARRQNAFTTPVMNQSIKVMSKNQKLKQILGYPLSYKSAYSNQHSVKENQQFYQFTVNGPRGQINVQMVATSIPINKIDEKITPIEEQIDNYKMMIQDLNGKVKIQKDKHKIQDLNAQINIKKSELQLKSQQLQKQKLQVALRRSKYYIPSKQLYRQILSNSSDKDQALSPDTVLFGIDKIIATLPNKNKLTILSDKQSSQPIQGVLIQPTYYSIKNKMDSQLVGLTDEEIFAYSKHKTRFMYRKYENQRLFFMLCATIGAGLLLLHFYRTRLKSITGGVLAYYTENNFNRIIKETDLLKQLNVGQLQFNNKLMGGGVMNKKFRCFADIEGIRGGKLIFQGQYISKQQKYIYDKFMLQHQKNGKKQQIDLIQYVE